VQDVQAHIEENFNWQQKIANKEKFNGGCIAPLVTIMM